MHVKYVKEYLVEKQHELATHPFFMLFQDGAKFEQAMDFAPGLTFWVFVFQDILRLNEVRMRDPALRRIARHHRAEDKGHDTWFIQDIAALDAAPRDVLWLFGPHHARTRDASYAVLAEVYRATDDYQRVALLFTLEAAGHVFFERVAAFVDKDDQGKALRYFSGRHLAVEKEHELFEQEMTKPAEIELTQPARAEILAMIDRCFEAFWQLFSALESRLARRVSGTYSITPQPLDTLRASQGK